MSKPEEITVPKRSSANRHRVPKKQWRKWCPLAKWTFNEVYGVMAKNHDLFLHPKDFKTIKAYWTTTAFNAAWTAADAVQGGLDFYQND